MHRSKMRRRSSTEVRRCFTKVSLYLPGGQSKSPNHNRPNAFPEPLRSGRLRSRCRQILIHVSPGVHNCRAKRRAEVIVGWLTESKKDLMSVSETNISPMIDLRKSINFWNAVWWVVTPCSWGARNANECGEKCGSRFERNQSATSCATMDSNGPVVVMARNSVEFISLEIAWLGA
jgi:hypothetical protein